MVERQLGHHRDELAGRGGRQRRAGRAGILTSFRRDGGQELVGGGWGLPGLRCRAVTLVCGRTLGGHAAALAIHAAMPEAASTAAPYRQPPPSPPMAIPRSCS